MLADPLMEAERDEASQVRAREGASAALTGYASPAYADSLVECGDPLRLPASGASLLRRPIRGIPNYDAIGCYPLFACDDWTALEYDIAQLEGELVSVALVTDPFGDFDIGTLQRCFRDRVMPFKQHFVIDFTASPHAHVAQNHRRNARKALAQVDVEHCPDPPLLLDEWLGLYANLIRKHGIRGIAAFSPRTFAKQLRVPGLVAFRAVRGGETIGMTLWYMHRDVVYYHLGAYSERGYETRASFALFSTAIGYFAERGLHWLDLGAGAGLAESANDGLSRFKRGWSTGARTAYFCGRILAQASYAEAVRLNGAHATAYFPAYRYGEFA